MGSLIKQKAKYVPSTNNSGKPLWTIVFESWVRIAVAKLSHFGALLITTFKNIAGKVFFVTKNCPVLGQCLNMQPVRQDE
jgi:hypothetical protein